jgi:hypothetical protein
VRYFLNRDRGSDSWTYGDWRQYVCRRGDGALQRARVSALWFFATVLLPAFAVAFGCLSWIVHQAHLPEPNRGWWAVGPRQY